ncbi:LysR family transcriptional regulator [Vibrio sp. SCSIO 43132]|uniref:LysR family transcriptional regulator n=1 Tax=Vibrio TaxID=662 RepID=UPI001CA9C683|nr:MULTISPECIES: LysR family transcriptional regulator [Vibrio]UAB73215.1 LysR family transcriptional regulator [Vibrio sp. SCSIO 43132]BDU41002.1 LysR family transcriptional regulator [Vibrio nigripulchritudo]BDU46742.1 LysR family transcriptional regulator [Vibrio nigripulchritudo]
MHKFMTQFLEVATQGSVTVAAKKLCISQPTLTHNMKKLELELGCKIFNRTSRGVTLTEYGEVVYEKAQSMKRIHERMIATLDNMNQHHRNEIRLGTGDAWWILFVNDLVESYSIRYPTANIHVEIGSQLLLMDKLLSEEVDIFLGHEIEGLTRSGQVHFLPLFVQSDSVFARKYHPLSKGTVSRNDLEDYPKVNIGLSDRPYSYLKGLEVFDIEIDPFFQSSTTYGTNSLMVAIDWLTRTDALFAYPSSMSNYLAMYNIKPLDIEEKHPLSTIGIYLLKERIEDNNLQTIILEIKSRIQTLHGQ